MVGRSMEKVAENLKNVQLKCAKAAEISGRKSDEVSLVVVSKTYDGDQIRPALETGHRIFGENRVQESQGKWPDLKADYEDVELHLIGPLQSNKAAEAVALFDVIHTIDRDKIAKAISKELARQERTVQLFIQVNTGSEPQKAGVEPDLVQAFHDDCTQKYGLIFEGLMCIPPVDENPGPHFALLRKLAEEIGVSQLSMGMSSDFEMAIELGATHVRVGSTIFGSRD